MAMFVAGVLHGVCKGVVALLKGADQDGKSISPLEWWHHFAINLIVLVVCIVKFVHDLFEYVPEDNAATAGVSCLVLVFHVALWFILTFRIVLGLSLVAPGSDNRMPHDMDVSRVLGSLHSRRTVYIYLVSAVGSSVTAWLLTGYALESIVVSGILPAQIFILVCLLCKSIHDGLIENMYVLHMTVHALRAVANRWAVTVHNAAGKGCCACIWPAPKKLEARFVQADQSDHDEDSVGLDRSSTRETRDSRRGRDLYIAQIQDDLPAGATANLLASDMAPQQRFLPVSLPAAETATNGQAEAEAARNRAAKEELAEEKRAADKFKSEADEAADQRHKDEEAALKSRRKMEKMEKEIEQMKEAMKTEHEKMKAEIEQDLRRLDEARAAQSEEEAEKQARKRQTREEELAEVRRLKDELMRMYEAARTPTPTGRRRDNGSQRDSSRDVAAAEAEVARQQDLDDPVPETPKPKVKPK